MTLQKMPTPQPWNLYIYIYLLKVEGCSWRCSWLNLEVRGLSFVTWEGFKCHHKMGKLQDRGEGKVATETEPGRKPRHGHKPGSSHSCLHTCCQLQGRREEGRGRFGEETWRFEHHCSTHILSNCHVLTEVTVKLALELAPRYFRSKHVCLKVPSKAPCLWMGWPL